MPATAQPMDTSAPTQVVTWSATSLRSWRKLRCRIATGTAISPLTSTERHSSRTTGVASGWPISWLKAGAPR